MLHNGIGRIDATGEQLDLRPSRSFASSPAVLAAHFDGSVSSGYPHLPNSRQLLRIRCNLRVDGSIEAKVEAFLHCPGQQSPDGDAWVGVWRQVDTCHRKEDLDVVCLNGESISA